MIKKGDKVRLVGEQNAFAGKTGTFNSAIGKFLFIEVDGSERYFYPDEVKEIEQSPKKKALPIPKDLGRENQELSE